jgi:putative transposase
VPGVAVHIIQRGNDRAACFRRDSDYLLYLLHLRQLSERFSCSVHAYCLMTNHVHLLLTPATREGCSTLMRNLGQRYVQYFNRTYERTGTLWEGRFRSCLVDTARYALACQRYIELNPLRAKMVAHPGEYPWSSYRTHVGTAPDAWLTQQAEYLALSEEVAMRREAYRRLLEADLEPELADEIRAATHAGRPLGGDAFKAAVEREVGRSTDPRRPGRPHKSGSEPIIPHVEKSGSDLDFQNPSHTLS